MYSRGSFKVHILVPISRYLLGLSIEHKHFKRWSNIGFCIIRSCISLVSVGRQGELKLRPWRHDLSFHTVLLVDEKFHIVAFADYFKNSFSPSNQDVILNCWPVLEILH